MSLKLDTITLHPVMHAVSHTILEREVDNLGELTLHPFLSATVQGMVLQLTSCIYGQRIVDYEITYPKDWWEAVKERWAPAWAKKRWPVKYRNHQIKLTELYPRIRVPKTAAFSIQVPVVERYDRVDGD